MIDNSVVLGYIAGLFVLANLPFLNQRLFLVIPVAAKGASKSFWFRLAEFVVLYAVGMAIGLYIEQSIGGLQQKTWVFWAVTIFMFGVFSSPGFIWQYQLRKHLHV